MAAWAALQQHLAVRADAEYSAICLQVLQPGCIGLHRQHKANRVNTSRVQALDAEEDLGVGGGSGGEAFAAARRAQEKAEGLLAAHPLSGDATLPHRLEALAQKQARLPRLWQGPLVAKLSAAISACMSGLMFCATFSAVRPLLMETNTASLAGSAWDCIHSLPLF